MTAHLTDLACLEWVRARAIMLAPETTFGVETHLERCAECRKKIDHFSALDRSCHPYGAALPTPRALRVGRGLKVAALALGVVAVVTGVLALWR